LDAHAGAGVDLAKLPRNMVQNTMRILDHEDAILKRDPDHFEVISLRTPSRRVGVYRRGDVWRCKVDKHNTDEQPCSHILAVLIFEGNVDLPNSAGEVWTKGKEGRDHALETKAWELVPTKLPELLARLLTQAEPWVAPPEPPRNGRPPKPFFPQAYQAVMRVTFRQSLRCNRGAMLGLDHRQHNPYGPVGVATLSRFLAADETTERLEKLLALTTWPARPYETLVHPDGTGLTEQHFSAWFDEKYGKSDGEKPREHHWTYAEMLWSYRYTLVAAIHTQQGPFGEAPWLIPLLDRALLTLNVTELGGDKAYNAHYIFAHLAEHGIDPQIKLKANANPQYSHARKKAYKRTVEGARLDPEGYAAKANRRNNAETGNHAFKAILGDQVYCKGATAQRNEILSMCIAYNLTRLVYLAVERGIEPDFAAGVQHLASQPWQPLPAMRAAVDRLRK
jgi:hypothetical protein